MFCFKFGLFPSIIFASCLLYFANSLYIESINGGYRVQREQYTYQAGILIPYNDDIYPYQLICSGAFISQDLVLSVAQCFVDDTGILVEYMYSITYSTLNWKNSPGTVVLIDKIYIPRGGSYHYLNNVAVSKLIRSLTILNNQILSSVNIPLAIEPFAGRAGHVTGYGYSWFLMDWDHEYKKLIRVAGGSENWLEYGVVTVSNQVNCKIGKNDMDPERYFCGEMLPKKGLNTSGLCENDRGSPLVIDNEVVGLAGSPREDCDDTKDGGHGYIKVPYYAQFINSIINKTLLPTTLVRYNRILQNSNLIPMLAASAA